MALTNNVGADGRTHDLPSPAIRNAFGNQTIILDDNEVFNLNGLETTDTIPRTFLVTMRLGGGATMSTSNTQAAIVHFWQDVAPIVFSLTGGATVFEASTNPNSITNAKIAFGCNLTDGTKEYFVANGAGANTVITMSRIDGMVQDLIAETA